MVGIPDGARTWIRRGAVAAGVTAVLLALSLVALEGVLPAPVRTTLSNLAETVGKSVVAWSLAVLGTGYALWRVARGRRRPPVAPELAESTPEPSALAFPRTGNRFEAIVESHARATSDPTADGDRIREALADVVVDVETRGGDRSPDAVRDAIERGTWTDDRIAAAFLGGDPAPGFPLGARFRGWIRPSRAFERRVERTVTAIHERMEHRRQAPERGSTTDPAEVTT